MRITKQSRKYQMGGPVEGQEMPMEEAPMEQEAPQGGGQDPIMMLAQMSAQALQNQDCNMAMQVCQAFIQMVQQMAGPEEAPSEPVMQRRGGTMKVVRRIK